MSDNSISIVPKISTIPNNKTVAKNILDWLIERDIVKSTPSNCILNSNEKGYAISEGARSVTISIGYSKIELDQKGNIVQVPVDNYIPTDLVTNGLEIITQRHVFDTGENYINELICPNCNENIAHDDWDLYSWNDEKSDCLICPQCQYETEIHRFSFTPEWGFSDLGFKFWNWPDFTTEFVDEFKCKLNCEIAVIYQYI